MPQSSPSIYKFQITLANTTVDTVYVQVLRFSDKATQVWIGDQRGVSGNLALAFPQRNVSTKLLGACTDGDDSSCRLAQKLSKKLEKPVFVGYNLALQDSGANLEVEKKILEEIRSSPGAF